MKTTLLIITLLAFIGLDANAQWQQTSTPPGGSIWSIAVIGTNIFVGTTNDGVYYSPDEGATWVQRNGSSPITEVLSLVANGSDLYAGTKGGFMSGTSGIYKSTDYGLTWSDVTPSGIQSGTYFSALVINGSDIFAGCGGLGNVPIYKSPLSGINAASWTPYNTGFSNSLIRSLASSGANILAGTYGDGVWISAANNANWSSTSGMSTNADYIHSLSVSGSNVFAGNISGATPVLYRSTDNGLTWTPSSTSVFAGKPVYAIIHDGNTIYAGTELAGVMLSTDNGATWTAYNNGLITIGSLSIRCFGIIGNKLLAGTDYGVWKSDISTGIMEADEPLGVSIYPNPASEIGRAHV